MAEPRRQQDKPSAWISIPSIPAHRMAQGFLAFVTAIVIATAIDAMLIAYNHQPRAWPVTAEMLFDDGGSIVAWALPATWPLMEVFRMVLAGIYERRRREKALAEGIAIGRAEAEKALAEGIAAGRAEAASEGTFEEGIAAGRKKGFEEGIAAEREKALAESIAAGREKALAEGIAIGEARAQAAGLAADTPEPARAAGWPDLETQQRWLAWNWRRLQTEARGDIFAEEPPAAAGVLCAQTHQLWLEWNIRRLEAETRGAAFDEPPPGLGAGDDGDGDA